MIGIKQDIDGNLELNMVVFVLHQFGIVKLIEIIGVMLGVQTMKVMNYILMLETKVPILLEMF